jgi:hypothetical protein
MKNRKPISKVHPACRDFEHVVEELLERRRSEIHQLNYSELSWREQDWGPRTWTRTELEYMVYSSYKQMRNGRITRPPRRETVMEIAGYLNCNLEERNRLLVAAELPPVSPYLNGDSLEAILKVAISVAQDLAMPAMIINRDWKIHYFNEHLIRLYGVTPDQLAFVAPEQMNILNLLFDPKLPLYPRLIQNRTSWTRMVRQTIFGFKSANTLYQFEAWYQDLVAQLMRLPEFEKHWRTVSISQDFERDASAQDQHPAVRVDTIVSFQQTDNQHAWIRPLLISVGYFQFQFPQIVAFLPADYESQTVFKKIGVPFSQNR